MSIYKKLWIAPLGAIVMMLIFGAAANLAISRQDAALDDIFNSRYRNYEVASKTFQSALSVHSNAYRLMTWISNYDPAKFERSSKEQIKELETPLAAMQRFSSGGKITEQEKKLAQAVIAGLAEYKKQAAEALDLAAGDVNMAMMSMQTADATFQRLSASFAELIALENKMSQERFDQATSSAHQAFIMAGAVLAGAIVLAALLTLYMGNMIVRPLKKAIDVASQISQGNLAGKIETTSTDETGQLLLSLKAMQASLKQIIQQIAESAELVSGAATELSSSSKEIAGSSQQQSAAASSIAAAIEEMAVSTEMVAENTQSAKDVVQKAANVSSQGQAMVEHAALEINRIAETVGESTTVILQLQKQSNEISSIATVIREIADQTNLLALNASIEAARAGEQGRGFAVVAEEVSKLAARTTDATARIKVIIDNVQNETQKAVGSMATGSKQVGKGAELVNELVSPLQELRRNSSDAVDKLVDLAHATKEQSAASTNIASSVEKIVEMAEENQAAVQQTANSAARLGRLAENLTNAAKKFRL